MFNMIIDLWIGKKSVEFDTRSRETCFLLESGGLLDVLRKCWLLDVEVD